MTTVAMKTHLALNLTTLCEVVRLTASDGTVAGLAAHTRDLTFETVTYKAAAIEPTRPVRAVGLESDTSEIRGAFTDDFTKEDVLNEKWRGAELQREVVNYLDLTMGSTCKQVGTVGKIEPIGDSFLLEFRSQVDRLKQKVGDLTSNVDRNKTIAETGLDEASFTHSTTVTNVTDRRTFKVSYVPGDVSILTNGRVVFTSGDNDDLAMEIKSAAITDGGTKTQITLQIPMRSTIAVSDTLNVIEGYTGDRARAMAIGAMLDYAGEPDMPTETKLIQYPG